jgi:hypothetical protein
MMASPRNASSARARFWLVAVASRMGKPYAGRVGVARFFLLIGLLCFGAAGPVQAAAGESWRGVHVWVDNDASARQLLQVLPALASLGVNQVVIEVNYSFEFRQHPELRARRYITAATARELAAAARTNGVTIIPEFNCLGHQSFGHRASPLLKAHPDFSETPSLSATSPGMYCLSWCPRAPGLNEIVFSLIDEIAEAFEATSFHVGMDEVYLIGEQECPRCHGANPARLFADQVTALHQHLVDQRKMRMLMWADRVIGPKYQGASRYDNPHNDLSSSIDLIPRDIVMCDWHYEFKRDYPSVPYLASQGFQVWPAGFMPLKASQAFSDYSLSHRTDVIGYLATTWNETPIAGLPTWPPIQEILPRWREKKANAIGPSE